MSSPPVASERSVGGSGLSGRRRNEEEDHGNDEEGEDMWAAVDRLPSYERARTTVLEKGQGSQRELATFDIKDVDFSQYLSTHVFKLNNPPKDLENFLGKVKNRMDRVGVEQPTIEVRYKDLNVHGEIRLGSRGLPTLINTTLNFFEGILTSCGFMKSKMTDLLILDGVSGILKPGRMTLLLGPPSSGKSTLLMALAGMLDENLKADGDIQYNGHSLDEFQPRRTSLYVSQDDLHIAEFTVRETMDYSARYQGVGSRADILREVLRREKERHIQPDPEVDFFMKATAAEDTSHVAVTEYTMRFLGLDICADTIAGDQMTRGISGGQRKRLTTGEILVGPSNVLFMDEISTGLDSTTTYEVVNCIGQNAHILKYTVLVSLLQPAPETYDLFDDIILMSGGYIVYHGPLEHVEEFFLTCGFKCPPRKHVADFLQEVTSSKNQEQYWAHKHEPYRYVPVKYFADAFKKFHVGQKLQEELAVPFDQNQGHQGTLVKDKYALPQWDLFKITFKKELLYLRKNYALVCFIFIQLSVMYLINASLYFRTLRHHRNITDASQFSGALFYVSTGVALLGYNEIVFMSLRKKFFHKFRKMYYYPAWTWALSMFLTKIPIAIVESFLATSSSYYIIGFAPAAARYFKLWLILFFASMMSSGLFRMLGAICSSPEVAGSGGGYLIMILFSLSGYILPRTHMKHWLKWAYWACPLSYLQAGVTVNEFLAHQWKKYQPSHPEHSVGHRFMLSRGVFDRGFWYWLSCGALIAFSFGFYLMCAFILTFVDAAEKSKTVISKELLAERYRDKTGEGVEYEVLPMDSSLPRSLSSGPLAIGSESMRASQRRASRRSDLGLTLGSDALQSVGSFRSLSRGLSGTSQQSFDYEESRVAKRGMVLPFMPLSIAFRDISYYVDMPADSKQAAAANNKLQLLKTITGVFRPGVLTALVGVTGAGKSTLMDVLSGRKTKGLIEGDIFINGFPKQQDTFARISGYCEQNDIHTAQVTIEESLLFSAWLRLPADVPSDMKKDFCFEVLDLVELTSLRKTLVGFPGETGLSTEQRKRLTIAVELVANPSIVFMDEPTSGLDARAAATVMRAVRNTVDTGRTVVCTIHQPSIDIFEAFDELLLLKRGGQTVYAGPLGRDSRHLIEYFERFEGIPKIKDGSNPAAWMLEITAPGMEQKLGVNFAELYRQSSVFEQVKALVQENSVPAPGAEDLSFPTKYARNYWTQFKCVLWKQNWAYWRNPGYNLSRLCLCVASALLMGIVFWGLGNDIKTEATVFSVLGAVYTSQLLYAILTSNAVAPMASAARIVFYRERSAGMYNEVPYAIAMIFMELPYTLTTSITFAFIAYSMIQLKWHADKFFWYLYFTFCSQFTASIFGFVYVVLTPSQNAAIVLLNFSYNVFIIFTGFTLPHNKWPIWWRWIFYIQPPALHIYGTLVAQFGDEFSTVVTTQDAGVHKTIPDVLRQSYGYGHSELGFVATLSALFPFVLVVVVVLGFKYINYQQR